MNQDLRIGLRMWLRHRLAAVAMLATLAIGIGASTSIFSFVDGVMLKPLPYANADRIVRLLETPPRGGTSWISTLDYLDWQRDSKVFETLAVQQQGTVTMTDGPEPLALRVLRVSANYFDVFGAGAALGRTFLPGEDTSGRERVVVLSYSLWQRRFGGSAEIVGSTIRLDGTPYEVVGVTPERSAFNRTDTEIFQPLAFQPANMTRDYRWLNAAFARLAPGVSIEQAQTQMSAVAARIAADNPDSHRGWGVTVERYADSIVGRGLRTSLLALTGAVAGLLAICCANLVALAFGRAVARAPEMAVRSALGASRYRLMRQFVAENLVLAAFGGVAGTGLAYAGIAWMRTLLPPGTLPGEASVSLDLRALLFAVVLTVATATMLGIVPILQMARTGVSASMRDGARQTTVGSSRRRILDGLVIAEIAVAVMLFSGSATLARSFFTLLDSDTGFVEDNVLTMTLPVQGFPPGSLYSSPEDFQAHVRRIQSAVTALPGVRGAALTSSAPLTDCCLYGMSMQIENHQAPDRASRATGSLKVVTPQYFSTLGLALRHGRLLDERDVAGSIPAVVINERFAGRYFPNEDPVGKHITNPAIVPGKTERGPDVTWEVVGVVANEKISAMNDDTSAVAYSTYEQNPVYFMSLVVRGDVDAETLEKSVRTTLLALDAGQGIRDVRTLAQRKSASVTGDRFQTLLSVIFAGAALLLAAVGIYGVLSYSVAQRLQELGVRAAFGATSDRLLALVLLRGASLTGAGLVLGLGASLAMLPLLRSIVYRVDVYDARVLGAATIVLATVALAACAVPARRAASVHPIAALRGE